MVSKSFFGTLSLVICLSSFALADDDKSTDTKKTDPPKPVIVDDSKSNTATDETADKSTKSANSKKDDSKKDADAKTAADDSDTLEALPTGKIKGRLPNGFTKLKITDPQRQKIYSIQASFKSQIDDLQKQLADLQVKRDTEIMNVLNDDQKKLYADLFGTATKSRSSKKTMLDEATADTKPAADDAKTPTANKATATDKKTAADKSTGGAKNTAAK